MRAIDGISANVRWACMFYCLQSPHSAQVVVTELCPPYCSKDEIGTAEIGTAEVSKAEVSKAEVGTAEVGIEEGGIAEGGMAEMGTAEVSKTEVSTAEVGVAEGGMAEMGIAEGTAEEGTAEEGTAEVGVAEVGIAEVGIAEVGMAEVRLCSWMLLSPCIPSVWPLPQYFQLVLICHVEYLLCSDLIIERCGYVCKHFSFCFSSEDRSPLVLLAQWRCSLRHDTGKPCLSKYITACLSLWWFKAHLSYAVFLGCRYHTTRNLKSLSDFPNDMLKEACEKEREGIMDIGIAIQDFITVHEIENHSPYTIRNYRRHLENFRAWVQLVYGIVDTDAIQVTHLRGWVSHLQKKAVGRLVH